jgi:hypothetical protein
VNQFSYATYSCEMPESLFATFPSSDTFSQHLYSEVAAKFLAVLEAVSDGLCRAVNSNRNAVNSYILDSLCQCLAGESDEAQFQATGHRLFRFKVDGHPNRSRVKWKKPWNLTADFRQTMPLGTRLHASIIWSSKSAEKSLRA